MPEGKAIEIHEVSVEQLIQNLDDPSSVLHQAKEHHVVMDVGATNCRVAIVARGEAGMHDIGFVHYTANSVSELRAVLTELVRKVGKNRLKKVVAASANVPCPVSGIIGGPISNYKGDSIKDRFVDMRTLPHELFPLGRTQLLNDLEACAQGIVATSTYRTFDQHFSLLWPAAPNGKIPTTPYTNDLGAGHCVVIAPGTGLGVAIVQYHNHTKSYTVMPLEFGHTSVAYTKSENDYLDAFAAHLKRPQYPVEYDDLCTGRGLEFAYQYISKGKTLTAAQIGKKAAAKDPIAMAALRMYNKWTMIIASQLTMGFQPRTVILCGDNTIRNKQFYESQQNVADMRKEFLNHNMERYGFMSRAHVVRQVHKTNLNILGCAFVCEEAHKRRGQQSKL